MAFFGSNIGISNAETETTGTITASAQNVQADASASNLATIFVSGTHAGVNLTWEVSNDGSNWNVITAYRIDTGILSTTTGVITSNATVGYNVPCNGARYVRARSTAWTSGTLAVRIRCIPVGIPSWIIADTELPVAAASADGAANPTTPQIMADAMQFNGATWDRNRNNANVAVDTSSARVASGNGSAQVNYNGVGMVLALNVTAVSGTTPTMTLGIQHSYNNGTTFEDIDSTNLRTVSITEVGHYYLSVYPGLATVANRSANQLLPRTWRTAWTIGGTTPSFTFTTFAQYID